MAETIASMETPALVVDEAVALRNIEAFQAHCDKEGLVLRPHIKTHKTIHFARAQIAAGARGITCQKISEAEIMADGGLDDILITYNIVGDAKLARLYALNQRVPALSVVADNNDVVEGLAKAFATTEKPLGVMVECDTGGRRCGVQTPQEALELASRIARADGLTFAGLMTYPAAGGAMPVTTFFTEAKRLLDEAALPCPVFSSGGSPDMWQAARNGIISEYRIGTYIYNDRSLIERGTCSEDDCAARVVATVVSTPTPERAIIDAGSKVLTSDLLGFSDYGLVIGRPDIRIVGLSEEHGVLSIDPAQPLSVGDRLEIIPNHVCVVSNMFDTVWLKKPDGSLQQMRVDGRGGVT